MAINGTITLFAAMFGAGVGAWFAFKLERMAKKQDKKESNVDAVLDAMLSLLMMWNEVNKYRRQIIDPHRYHPLRHIQMEASIVTGDKFNVPWGQLVFITSQNGNLLPRAKDMQLTFFQFIQSIEERSRELHDVRPIIRNIYDYRSEEEWRRALGERLFESMKNRANGIVGLADSLHEQLPPLINDLRATTIAIYPDMEIPEFEFAELTRRASD